MKRYEGITGIIRSAYHAISMLLLTLGMIMCISFSVYAASPGDITTVAGNGTAAFSGDNGAATSASLKYPNGVAIDNAGNLYIADKSNNRIRKVAAGSGIITTVAGNGTAGFSGDGAAATSASLYDPEGVSVDSSGNLYVADTSNNRIRKVAAGSGIITTVAGNGTQSFGGDGGAATLAKLNNPGGVAIDNAGNLYIADGFNNCIRKVTAISGIISTVAGKGTGTFGGNGGAATLAYLDNPRGVAVDSAGNLYIADSANNCIRKVSAVSGIITNVAGNGAVIFGGFGGDGGVATSASLNGPEGITLDSAGNIYIADTFNFRIRKVAADSGIITTVAGNGTPDFAGDGSVATSASLNYPSGVILDSTGNLYITDFSNNRIRKVINPEATSAAISYSLSGPYKAGDLVTITATFNNLIADTPATQIALSGANSLTATNMTKVDSSHYTYAYTIGAGLGTVTVSLPNGIDTKGIPLASTPSSGADFRVIATPTVTTGAASSVTLTDAILNATVNDNGANTSVNFEYGLTTGYGSSVSGSPVSSGTGSTAVQSYITGLACNTTYHYRVVGLNSAGTSNGNDVSLTTSACIPPFVTTLTATAVNTTGATLRGSINFNGAATIATFEYGLTTGYGNITTAAESPLTTGTSGYPSVVTAAITGLTCGTTYHYRAIGKNSAGTTNSLDATFNSTDCPAAGSWIITTMAGNGTGAFDGDGGAATAASLYGPNGVTVDSVGSLYIADYGNSRIRKVAADTGIITTVAGNGSSSYAGDGGTASAASLSPTGVTVDSAGNLYIADKFNNRIRRVDAVSGIITTVAGKGTGSFGGDGGAATSAYLKNPNGVTIDSSGNLYIADSGNNRVRKVTARSGIITTVVGNGTGTFGGDDGAATSASLYNPTGVSVDSAENLYIADSNNNRIRKLAAVSGIITTVAGNGTGGFAGDGGAATSANLYNPDGVTIDSAGDLYISNPYNYRIRKVAASSDIITTVAGNGTGGFAGDGGAATAARLSGPRGVAVDSAGNLYIADFFNNRIRKVFKPGATTTAISYSPAGPYKSGDLVTITATFNNPVADAPVPQIALSGANTLSANNMTKVDSSHYTHVYTVGGGTGVVNVSLPSGIDINGVQLSSTPSSGATFSVLPTTYPTAAISYSPAGPYKLGDTITITADFSEAVADSPVMKIEISSITGGSALPATNMTKVSSTRYMYSYIVGNGNGSANISLSTGTDLGGNAIIATPTSGGSFTVIKTPASVVLGGLTQTYDGTPKSVTATTTPAGLTVTLTYAGSVTPPINIGSYAVIATINDVSYQGTASGTLTIKQAILSVSVGGNGKGNINSIPSGITCSEGTTGDCSFSFPPGTMTLHATPSTISLFDGWSGCTTSASTSCDVLIDGNKSVSATFTLAHKAMIVTTGYESLNAAYLAAFLSADASTTINLLDAELTEGLDIIGKEITLRGGFSADYKTRSGQPTFLKGKLIIKGGSLRVAGVTVRPNN